MKKIIFRCWKISRVLKENFDLELLHTLSMPIDRYADIYYLTEDSFVFSIWEKITVKQ